MTGILHLLRVFFKGRKLSFWPCEIDPGGRQPFERAVQSPRRSICAENGMKMGHLRLRLSAKMPHGQLVSQLLLGFRREMFDLNKAARPKPYRRRLL